MANIVYMYYMQLRDVVYKQYFRCRRELWEELTPLPEVGHGWHPFKLFSRLVFRVKPCVEEH